MIISFAIFIDLWVYWLIEEWHLIIWICRHYIWTLLWNYLLELITLLINYWLELFIWNYFLKLITLLLDYRLKLIGLLRNYWLKLVNLLRKDSLITIESLLIASSIRVNLLCLLWDKVLLWIYLVVYKLIWILRLKLISVKLLIIYFRIDRNSSWYFFFYSFTIYNHLLFVFYNISCL